MRHLLLAMVFPLVAGCPTIGMKDLTPEQIKAMDGLLTCSQIRATTASGSIITANPDRLPKGNALGETEITCGDASMKIKNSVTVPPKQ